MNQNFNIKQVFQDPLSFIAFGFGSGLSPIMPGTCGTIMGVIWYLLLCKLPFWIYLSFIVIAYGIGIWICENVSNKLGVHDYPGIVWDEMVGFWITMIGIPCDIMTVISGFVLFRIFDIWKPWPISWVNNNIKGGHGIMFDDLLAAIPSCVILNLIMYFINH